MNINEISRFMNMYMMNSTMNSGTSSTNSIGSDGSSKSILFEYMLKAAQGKSSESSCCEHCTYNKYNVGNNNTNKYNMGNNINIDKIVNLLNSSKEQYGASGDFVPMGKAPRLSEKDINISPRIQDSITNTSKKYGVDEDFVKAIIKQESNFNPNCKSGAGAMGLMQLMSYNCSEYSVKNPYNIEDNINGGVKYIRELLEKFDGNKQLALSAYNGGITRMSKRGVDTVPEIVNMPKETRDYVSKVMGYYKQYNQIKVV